VARPRKASPEQLRQVAAQARAALLDPLWAAIREYLCEAAGLRHAATILEAHIRYLKQTKPAGWQPAVRVLTDWAELVEGLRRRQPAARRAELERRLGGARGRDGVGSSRPWHLTARQLETFQGLAEAFARISAGLVPMPWLWLPVMIAGAVEAVLEQLRAASQGAIVAGGPQAAKLRQGLAGVLLRPPGTRPPRPEAEAAYREWVAGQRAGRPVPVRGLAEKYLAGEYDRDPETAVRKMRRWLQRARQYYGDADEPALGSGGKRESAVRPPGQ